MSRDASIRVLVGAVLAGAAFAVMAQTSTPSGTDAGASVKASASARAAFAKADANHDGKLSKDEAAALPELSGKFDQLDKDKKGYLTLEEFASVSKTKE
jgi:Ca2+-binding EF-hand superfamily protein